MQDYLNLRNQAKQLKEYGDFSGAAHLYEQIYSSECDRWIAWEYANVLKKLSRLDDAIKVSKTLFQRDNNFTYNNNFLSWLLYDKYFKENKIEYNQQNIKQLFEIALFVTNFTNQERESAYEKIVIKTIKILKDLPNPQYEKILILIEKLDVSKLTDESGKYEKDGQEKEYQSPKEMYYSLKTKVLLETKKFHDCILCCDEAFLHIKQFHHDNNYWILARKGECLACLGDFNNAIKLLREIIIKKIHWSLFAELAKMYVKIGDNKNALLYFCRAALTSDPPKMKVGLYPDIAQLLLEIGDEGTAWKHLAFTASIRKKENWNIPLSISSLLNDLSLKYYQTEIKFDLKYFWRKKICEILEEHHGTINRLNLGGKTGFIQSDNKSYFFKVSSVMEKIQVKQNLNVTFVIVESFDTKKNKQTTECAYIMLDKEKLM